ncbi:MAG: hypothetical protein ABIV51_10410 [Saprospiraceae bacterium]
MGESGVMGESGDKGESGGSGESGVMGVVYDLQASAHLSHQI